MDATAIGELIAKFGIGGTAVAMALWFAANKLMGSSKTDTANTDVAVAEAGARVGIISMLREQIASLQNDMKDVRGQLQAHEDALDNERMLRRNAEDQVRVLTARVGRLESQVRALGQEPLP